MVTVFRTILFHFIFYLKPEPCEIKILQNGGNRTYCTRNIKICLEEYVPNFLSVFYAPKNTLQTPPKLQVMQ